MPNLLNSLLNTKLGKVAANPYAASGAAAIATVSNLTKDTVNCYYYVTQSLNNEEIPENKRKFVAGLDLANGILNVAVQSVVSFILNKYIGNFFDKHIAAKYFTEDSYKKMYQTMTNKIPRDNFLANMESLKGCAKIGLSVISTLVAMQVIAKRIIVPLIATPLASVFKKHFEKQDAKKAGLPEQKQNDNNDKDKTQTLAKNPDIVLQFVDRTKPECFKKFVNNHKNDKINDDNKVK